MYWQDIWRFPGSIEYEYKYAGNYGAAGEVRAEKVKATPEQIAKQNQRNKEKRMRRLIKANFAEDDLWVTLKYPKGTRKEIKEVRRDVKNFFQRLRRRYKVRGGELKFIYRIEIGKQGGIHIHSIINRIDGCDTDKLIKESWKEGHINYQSMYSEGGFEKLADYIVKAPDEEVCEQLSLFAEEDVEDLIRYSSSRNLVRPVPERKVYRRRTVGKLIKEGLVATPGYYIDKNSVFVGINQYTGYTYIQYIEYKTKDNKASPGAEVYSLSEVLENKRRKKREGMGNGL